MRIFLLSLASIFVLNLVACDDSAPEPIKFDYSKPIEPVLTYHPEVHKCTLDIVKFQHRYGAERSARFPGCDSLTLDAQDVRLNFTISLYHPEVPEQDAKYVDQTGKGRYTCLGYCVVHSIKSSDEALWNSPYPVRVSKVCEFSASVWSYWGNRPLSFPNCDSVTFKNLDKDRVPGDVRLLHNGKEISIRPTQLTTNLTCETDECVYQIDGRW